MRSPKELRMIAVWQHKIAKEELTGWEGQHLQQEMWRCIVQTTSPSAPTILAIAFVAEAPALPTVAIYRAKGKRIS